MKKIIFLITTILLFAGCSKDEDSVDLSVSQATLHFNPEKGEQTVDISSSIYWDCKYDADWLFVRQQQNKIRVIVDENPSPEERSEIINIIVNGSVYYEITVIQAGTKLDVENNAVTVKSQGETIIVPVNSNVQWNLKNELEWCNAQKVNEQLEITISRNYNMQERTGDLVLDFGDVSQIITITQTACEWFESFEMVEVESGTFYMGAQKGDTNEQNYDTNAYQIESPVHKVTLDSYSIGKFEVTQAQWVAAMGTNPSINQNENFPVENVTWNEVQEFIALLNEVSGLNYRLPTEAEWEFAAKGGNLSCGYKYSGNDVIGACAWYYSNSNGTLHTIGGKDSNELGIFDMSGNVREWCNDWFGYYTSTETENPQGEPNGSTKINRGGSWTTPAKGCRNSYRHTNTIDESAQDLGFRLALTK